MGQNMLSRLRHRWRHFPPVVTVVVGIGLSAVTFLLLHHREYLNTDLTFQQEAAERYASLKREIEFDLQAVEAVTAFYQASTQVDHQAFRSFVEPLLDRHPSIQALEWVPRVSLAEREAYERRARKEGFPGFRLTEKAPNGRMVEARGRIEYFPVYFVEPYKGNEAALGFDLASSPTREASLSLARDTGATTATPWITLVQETSNRPGFIVFAPVYHRASLDSIESRRKNLVGFALGVFRIPEIIELSLAHLTQKPINITLYDQSTPQNDRLLWSHSPDMNTTTPSPAGHNDDSYRNHIKYARSIDVAGRVWTVVLTPTRAYLSDKGSWHSWAALVVGLAITALLARYLFVTIGRARYVEQLVEERTRDLAKANADLHTEITEREKAEEAVLASEEKFKAAFMTGLDGVYIATFADGRVVEVNDEFESVFGYAREEAINKTLLELNLYHDPGDRERMVAELKERGWIKDFEVKGRKKDGQIRTYSLSISIMQVGDEPHILGIVRDITERKKMEDALRESETKFRAILDNSRDAISVSKDGIRTFQNPAFVSLFGYESADELVGKPLIDLVAPESRDFVAEVLKKRSKGEASPSFYEEVALKKDGSKFLAECTVSTYVLDGETFTLAVLRDITGRRKAEETLRRYELLSGHSRDVLLFMTREGSILEANAAAERAYGYSREELLKLTVKDLRAEETLGSLASQIVEADEHGILLETVHRRKDGSTFPVEVSARGVTIGGTRTLISIIRDITYRKYAQEALEESERKFKDLLVGV